MPPRSDMHNYARRRRALGRSHRPPPASSSSSSSSASPLSAALLLLAAVSSSSSAAARRGAFVPSVRPPPPPSPRLPPASTTRRGSVPPVEVAESTSAATTREGGAVGGGGDDVVRGGSVDLRALDELERCETGTAARNVLERALPGGDGDGDGGAGRLYGSLSIPPGASSRPLSDADLAIQTGVRNARYSVMELIELNGDRDADRASLALICLTAASSLSAIAADEALPGPEIVRFAIVWVLSFAPLAFVGYGIATPAELQTLLVSVQRNVFPTYRKRMVQHEAGHFLLGHLLGMPIRGYRANAVKNAVEFYPLSDSDVGRERARSLGFDVRRKGAGGGAEVLEPVYAAEESRPYFSEGGRGEDLSRRSVLRSAKNYTDDPFLKLPARDDPAGAWPYRGFDERALDRLAAVSVAGVCSEILAFGNAEGGYADLSQLRRLFASSESDLDEKDMENRVRFALGYATSQLRRHLGALDALAEVMERGGTVAECVAAIEGCDNVSGAALAGPDYERARRERIRSEGVGIVERILLGGGRNVDQEDDGVLEGKGGGDKRRKFALTGDDPLYAAGAAALAFFVWASSGGLSLH